MERRDKQKNKNTNNNTNNNKHSEESSSESEIEGLTQYDMLRKPILPIEDDVVIQLKVLNTEFKCPVCLGILHDTNAIMECLHRFCSECISKSLRLGKKECPSCRTKCASRRALRPDTNFDSIIRKIYPNLDEYEAKEDERLSQLHEFFNRGFLSSSIEEGMKRQSLLKRTRSQNSESGARRKRKDSTTITTPSNSTSNLKDNESKTETSPQIEQRESRYPSRSASTKKDQFSPPPAPQKKSREKNNEEELEEVEFSLLVHPKESSLPQLPRKYIKTTVNCTVRHLVRYVQDQFHELDLESNVECEISLSKRGRTLILPNYFTLLDILKNYWKTKADLILHYSATSTDLNESY